MNIIVTGSLAYDQIMNFPEPFIDHIMPDKLHLLSVSFLVTHLHKNYGGTSGNIAYTLGLLGKNPIILASAGKDAEDYKVMLEKNGAITDFMNIVTDDYTGSFVVITDVKDCQIAGFYPGAMQHDVELSCGEVLSKKNINKEEAFLVIAPTVPEAMVKNVAEAQMGGIRYLYSPAQQIPRLSKEDLTRGITGAEIVIGNDYEIALIEQKTEMTKEQMLEHAKIIVTTLGDRGSMIEQKDKQNIMIGVAKPKEVKDPTGSGDAFIAGFLSAYLDKLSLVECGQFGATAAVYVVERYGTTGHSYSLDVFENRLKENFSTSFPTT
jgi:adenosine kinase